MSDLLDGQLAIDVKGVTRVFPGGVTALAGLAQALNVACAGLGFSPGMSVPQVSAG